MFDEEFNSLNCLNVQQRDAVLGSFEQDSLVLAGAGSGKTRVLITRIEYILKVLKEKPSTIMAITFTKKAVSEISQRIEKITSYSDEMTVGTYHSVCIKLLKEFGEDINLTDFKVIEPSQCDKLASKVLKDMGLVASSKVVKKYTDKISNLKSELITPTIYKEKRMLEYKGNEELFRDDKEYDFIEFYLKLQIEKLENNLIDYDDAILYTQKLLEVSDNAISYIQDTFKYILCDEIQDSNIANIVLLNIMSEHCNLFIVGDLDQSIYGFRKAKPNYFLNLTKAEKVKLFKLEQNYRSTKTIVEASNALISNNKNRIDKVCFSENEVGEPISYFRLKTNVDEANVIASEIKSCHDNFGISYSDMMVLYRTRVQSEILEKELINNNVPCVVIGSTSFSNNPEIKNCLSFLRVAADRSDSTSFKRALMTLDDVGKVTVNKLVKELDECGDALVVLEEYKTNRTKTKESLNFLLEIIRLVDEKPVAVLTKIAQYQARKIKEIYKNDEEKRKKKLSNIKELLLMAIKKENDGAKVREFINQMGLLFQSDGTYGTDAVMLLTAHSSKGLESKVVFVAGMNEGIFPLSQSMKTVEEIEEERRLAYVSFTRPMDKLYITSYRSDGHKMFDESRFINEIPPQYIDKTEGS